MRLNLVLVVLLIVAATAVSYVWRGLSDLESGDVSYQLSMLLGLLAAILAGGLLARIVLKASAARQRRGGS